MIRILHGDARDMLRTLPDASVHCCVTSPPYWGLRDYGVTGQIGLERSPAEYVAAMVEVFAGVRRSTPDFADYDAARKSANRPDFRQGVLV